MAALRQYLNTHGKEHISIEGNFDGRYFVHTSGLIWDLKHNIPVSSFTDDFPYDGYGG